MTNNKTYSISLEKVYSGKPEEIFNLFQNGTIFTLTGANEIQSEFKTGKPFHLTFHNRGAIYGRFILITDSNIILEWNVKGFQRPDEIKTSVEISLHKDYEKCILTLDHKNIANAEAATAKQKAWTEILDDMEKKISIKH
jgi:hypothetical protein